MYVLESLDKSHLIQLLEQAVTKDGILNKFTDIKETDALIYYQLHGKLLNVFELVINTQNTKNISITNDLVMASAQENVALYDKTGEQHYDIISAFIKSIQEVTPMQQLFVSSYGRWRGYC